MLSRWGVSNSRLLRADLSSGQSWRTATEGGVAELFFIPRAISSLTRRDWRFRAFMAVLKSKKLVLLRLPPAIPPLRSCEGKVVP